MMITRLRAHASSTGWRLRRRIRAQTRRPTPGCFGRSSTRQNSTSTPRASSSRALVPAVAWPRLWRLWRVTQAGRGYLGQMPLYPMLDDRNDTLSARQTVGWAFGTRPPMRWAGPRCSGQPEVAPMFLPTRRTPGRTMSPGSPPAFIYVGSCENVRDGAITYASRISAAGGIADLPGGESGAGPLVAAPISGVKRSGREAAPSLTTAH